MRLISAHLDDWRNIDESKKPPEPKRATEMVQARDLGDFLSSPYADLADF